LCLLRSELQRTPSSSLDYSGRQRRAVFSLRAARPALESRSKDILGRVYEYFLGQFAAAEGKKGGQFYTAQSVVKLLVEMIEPYKCRVYDSCCGSGGMFVQSEKFAEVHGGRRTDLSIYSQESNQTTWRLCKMNLAIRGIESNIAWNSEGSFHNDAHKDLKADFILANPPFNDSDWGGESLEKMFVGNMAFRPLAMPTLLGFSTSSSSCAQRGRRVRSGQRLASCS
jgi:type I restriction-modification system DNA methylase subunit